MKTITLTDGSAASLPDAEALAGTNCGTPGVWRFGGQAPGPHLVITALIHGNEVCGAHAAGRLLEEPPQFARGTLTVAFCNLRAYAMLTDDNKSKCRLVDEDLNRVWGRLDAPAADADTYELARARELLPWLEQADALLDLHSMTDPAPALGLVGRASKNVGFARRTGFPALLVQDGGHSAGLRLIDRPRFADPRAAPVAMLVECGQHFSREAIEAADETVRRTIAAVLRGEAMSAPEPQSVIEVTEAVTIRTDDFQWVGEWSNMGVVPEAGTLVARDGDSEVRTPHANTYMVMPASEAFRKRGQTAVRFGRRT